VNENRTDDTVSRDSWPKRIPTASGPPPSLIPSGFAVIPWPTDIDPLYTGRLTGKVPDGWSRDGWLCSLRDRLSRVDERDDEKVVTKLLQRELEAIGRCANRKRS
jgi:hypothetical protein